MLMSLDQMLSYSLIENILLNRPCWVTIKDKTCFLVYAHLAVCKLKMWINQNEIRHKTLQEEALFIKQKVTHLKKQA